MCLNFFFDTFLHFLILNKIQIRFIEILLNSSKNKTEPIEPKLDSSWFNIDSRYLKIKM